MCDHLPVHTSRLMFLRSQALLSPHSLFFFFMEPPLTQIYTLSLHDALPIYFVGADLVELERGQPDLRPQPGDHDDDQQQRSEEHTSELQSRPHLVCRLLLEKKNYETLIKYTRARTGGRTRQSYWHQHRRRQE